MVGRNSLEFERHSGNGTEFWAGIFPQHCLLLRSSVLHNSFHFFGAFCKISLVVIRVLEESGTPRMSAQRLSGDVDGSSRNSRREEFNHGVLLQASLSQIASQLNHGTVSMSRLQIAAQKGMDGGNGKLVMQSIDNFGLHFKNFLLIVSAVSDVDEIAEFGRINLFVLGSNLKMTNILGKKISKIIRN